MIITHVAAAVIASANANAKSQIAKPAVAHSRPVAVQENHAVKRTSARLASANMVAMLVAVSVSNSQNAQWWQ